MISLIRIRSSQLAFYTTDFAGLQVGSKAATLVIGKEGRYRSRMIDWSSCSAVERDREKVSGSCVFRNTRVPVIALFENLEGGASLDDFLLWFPGVMREQPEAVLEHTIQSLRPNRQAA